MKQIFIYDPFATKDQMLNTNGRGILAASDARINWTKNGEYSANITVPKGAQGSDYFIKFAIVKIPTKHGKQLFRLESPEITLSGITAKAWHISYDLAKDVILNQKWTDKTGAEMLPLILDAGTFENRFTGTSDIVTYNSLSAQKINILKSLINTDIDDSFLKRYSGEVERDNFTFNINARQGADRGVSVLYRKNLTGLSITIDTSAIVTRAIPTCYDANGAVLMLEELYVDAATIENYPFPIIKEIPFSDIKVGQKDASGAITYATDAAARAEMIARVNAQYAEGLGLPVITLVFNFIELSNTVEYSYSQLENIYQGDTVTVGYDGTNYKLRVVQYTEDALAGRYDTITIGSVKNTIINTVASQLTATAAVKQQATSYAEAQAAFSSLVVNSLGIFGPTVVKQDNGSNIYYMHDQPLLADSTVIYKMTGYTMSWSPDAGLHWYGMSADGNIIANILSTIGVDAQWIRSWMITIDAGTGGKIVMNPTTPMRITRPPVVEDGETEEVFIGGLVKVLDRLALIASILANSENPNVWAEIGEKTVDGVKLSGILIYLLDELGSKYAAAGITVGPNHRVALGNETYDIVHSETDQTYLADYRGVPLIKRDASGINIYDAAGVPIDLGGGGGGSALSAYPVGSVYVTYASATPDQSFGGVWLLISQVLPGQNVKDLFHFDGENDSTVFTDEMGGVATKGGNPVIKTAIKKFGSGSVFFSGNGSYLIPPSPGTKYIASKSFTLSFWFYTLTDGRRDCLLGYGGSNGCFGLYHAASNKVLIWRGGNELSTNGYARNAWHHIAMVGDNGQTVKVYVDGNLEITSGAYNWSAQFFIGANESSLGECLNGYIDDFMFELDNQRWTTNFTPPASAFEITADIVSTYRRTS